MLFFCYSLQQIDEMLAGSLSQEDEDAVLAELEAITQVSMTRSRSFTTPSTITVTHRHTHQGVHPFGHMAVCC